MRSCPKVKKRPGRPKGHGKHRLVRGKGKKASGRWHEHLDAGAVDKKDTILSEKGRARNNKIMRDQNLP